MTALYLNFLRQGLSLYPELVNSASVPQGLLVSVTVPPLSVGVINMYHTPGFHMGSSDSSAGLPKMPWPVSSGVHIEYEV